MNHVTEINMLSEDSIYERYLKRPSEMWERVLHRKKGFTWIWVRKLSPFRVTARKSTPCSDHWSWHFLFREILLLEGSEACQHLIRSSDTFLCHYHWHYGVSGTTDTAPLDRHTSCLSRTKIRAARYSGNGDKYLKNAGKYLRNYTVSWPERAQSKL